MSIWSYGFKNNQERVDFLKGLIDKYSPMLSGDSFYMFGLREMVNNWQELYKRYSELTDDDISNYKKIEYLDIFGRKVLSPFVNPIKDDEEFKQNFIARQKINFLNNKLKRLKIDPIIHFFYGKNVQFKNNIVLAYNDDKSVVIYSKIKGNDIEYFLSTKYDHEEYTLKKARSQTVTWDITSKINEDVRSRFVKLTALCEAAKVDIDEDARFYANVNKIPISSINQKKLSLKISKKNSVTVTDAIFINQNMPNINASSVLILDTKNPVRYDLLIATHIHRYGYVPLEEIHTLDDIGSGTTKVILKTYLTYDIQNIHKLYDATFYIEGEKTYTIKDCSFDYIILDGSGTIRFKNTTSSKLFNIYSPLINCIFEGCAGIVYDRGLHDTGNKSNKRIEIIHSKLSLKLFDISCKANIIISDDSTLHCQDLVYQIRDKNDIEVITKDLIPQNMTYDKLDISIAKNFEGQGIVNILRSSIPKISIRGSYGKTQVIATLLNKHLAMGLTPRQRDIPGFEQEMIDAGFEEYL